MSGGRDGTAPPVVGARPAGPVEIWGVLNVTPDSFSDGGRFLAPEQALAHARAMLDEGADVIDVGGASSRPRGSTYGAGAEEVPEAEELARTLAVVAALAGPEGIATRRGARVSIDTTRASVARAALAAGAALVNDVSMGRDPALLDAVAGAGAELCLMHTRGDGRVDASTTAYRDVVAEVLAELAAATERAVRHGVRREAVWLDPGLGFAKTASQSAQLLSATSAFARTGHRVLVGASRKSFVAALAPLPDGRAPGPDERLGGSLAAVTAAVLGGARAVRVHDVAASRQAALVASALGAPVEVPRPRREEADAHG